MTEHIQKGSETLSYISSPEGLVAMHISDDNGRDEMKYVLTDYLGTIYALVDDGAQSTEDALYYSFNAWGERRELQAYDGSLTAPLFSDPADYITSRGYTGHEHIDAFDLINMNGRAYDPVVSAFLSPDPYVQAPDMPQNLNRYAYCLNNPLKYSDPSGEFFFIFPTISFSSKGGLSIGASFVFGIPGIASFQIGGGINLKSGQPFAYAGASLGFNSVYLSSSGNIGYSFGLSRYSGVPISFNSFTIGAHYNLNNNSFGVDISSWSYEKDSWNFDLAISANIFPEHTTNLLRGRGFRSNSSVFDRMMTCDPDITCDEVLDYFGFEGKFNPDAPLFKKHGDHSGITDTETGEIFYHLNPFEGNFDYFEFVADHEMRHSKNVKSGKYKGVEIDFEVAAKEEWSTYMYNYRNQGKYPDHGVSLTKRINYYGSLIGKYGLTVTPTGSYSTNFTNRWWHSFYKIPRTW